MTINYWMETILIVEDDPLVARLYRAQFEKAGFQVKVVEDGATALAAVQVITPDAILLDLMLPKLSGCEFLRRLRQMPEYRDLPVIAYTNAYLAQLTEQARQAGATEVVGKSAITPQVLIASFRYEISKQHASQNPKPVV